MSLKQGHDIGDSGGISREDQQNPNPFTLAKTLKVKLNGALLLKVRRWCRAGRLRLNCCEMCACVFPAIKLGGTWKTQSPPVSMETSSHSFADREAHGAVPHSESGVWIIPHFNARMLLTTYNNILQRMRISVAVTMMCVNLLKRLKINLVVHAAKEMQNENGALQTCWESPLVPF